MEEEGEGEDNAQDEGKDEEGVDEDNTEDDDDMANDSKLEEEESNTEETEDKENEEDEDNHDNDTTSSGELLQPKRREILIRQKNPNYMSLLNLREEGYDVIRYTTKSGKSLEYSATDKEEWNIIKKLIKKPAPGAQWRALYYTASTAKQYSTTKRSGKGFAEGFTTLSDEELSGNVNTIIASPKNLVVRNQQ